mgnify:CR=1 FL=1
MLTRYCAKHLKTNETDIVYCQQNVPFAVMSIWITNTSSLNTTFTIRHVPKSQASASHFDLVSGITIEPNTVQTIDSAIYLLPGDRLTAFASVSNRISMFVYGDLTGSYSG